MPQNGKVSGENDGEPLDLKCSFTVSSGSFQALNEVNQSASEMGAMKLDVPAMPVGESDGPDDCQESARQKEEDEKRKLKKALKLDPNWSKQAVAQREEKKRKKRKVTAFQEALKLEEEATTDR
eukprot:s45_g14.t1